VAENRIESVPQTAIEKALGFAGKLVRNTNKTLDNQIPGLGAIYEMFNEGAASLAEDMSWGQPILKPGGHGPQIDPRVVDALGFGIPAAGAAGKFGKAGIKELFRAKPRAMSEGGYILGPKAWDADQSMLIKARGMKKAGASDDEIFNQTKWWLSHPDGIPRWEKAHGDESYLSQEMLEQKKWQSNTQPAADYYNARQQADNDWYGNRVKDSVAQKQYGIGGDEIAFSNKDVNGDPIQTGSGSIQKYNNPGTPTANLQMYIGDELDEFGKGLDRYEDLYSIVAHENQHVISGKEGFAPGGNSSMANRIMSDKLNSDILDILVEYDDVTKAPTAVMEELTKMADMRTKLAKEADVNNTPDFRSIIRDHDFYESLADEAQARLVQDRWNMSQQTMDANPFYKSYPVKPENMIILDKNFDRTDINPSAIQRFIDMIETP